MISSAGWIGTTIPISKGGTGQTTAILAFNDLSPSTTKGDLIVNDGTNDVRLAVGTDGQQLHADSTQASGVKWATAQGVVFAGGAKLTVIKAGFIYYGSPSGVDVPEVTLEKHTIIMPTSGTCRDLYFITNTANGNGSTLAVTIQKGTSLAAMADTTLTKSIGSLAAAGVYSDLVNTFTIAAGEIIVIKYSCDNVANCSTMVGVSFRCIP